VRHLVAVIAVMALAPGCVGPGGPRPPLRGGALRISEVAASGDATRRASTRLVLSCLGSGDMAVGMSQCERAIAIDATNPYAYLAVAAHEIQWGDVERGAQFLQQAVLLLESENANSPRVAPHLAGLAGRAQLRSQTAGPGSTRSPSGLQRAARMAPAVWGDGWLTSDELR
jgi:Tfp pilus assembly protein PilF